MQTKQKIWVFALILILITVFSVLPAWAEKQQTADKKPQNKKSDNKVAVVNNAIIYLDDFEREFRLLKQRNNIKEKNIAPDQLSKLKNQALEILINNELLYQESQKSKIKNDKEADNDQLGNIIKQFSDKKEKTSGKNSVSDLHVRKIIEIKQFIDNKFAKDISVSDMEIKTFYNSNPAYFKQPEKVHARHILIKFDPKSSESKKAKARKTIEDIKQKLKQGEDFAALAEKYSQCPSSAKGGDLGFFGPAQMVKPFEDAAFALKPGEISDIVETRFGYHLIKVEGKKPETIVAFVDAKNKIVNYLKQEKINHKVYQYVEKLKEKATVEKYLDEIP